ncbi:hypothetical protein RhiirA4_466406 [Rhizophagus irregularis]|uniref:Uncharacterized protein n=1 Tax=Rhizophagus irregularis TaxID=588596 RepID=A0A2I1GU02_9GLOM|nr:hypothetical protein RhiirA4_466406 [Rhizophagus irregularis]
MPDGGYDEFIKEYGLKYKWGNERNLDELFIQGEESIVDYCLKAKKCNDIVKLCKDHFRSEFYSGLTPKEDVLQKMIIIMNW